MRQKLIAGIYGKWIEPHSYAAKVIEDEHRRFTVQVFLLQSALLLICAILSFFCFRAEWMQAISSKNSLPFVLISIPFILTLYISILVRFSLNNIVLFSLSLFIGWSYIAFVLSCTLLFFHIESTPVFLCSSGLSGLYAIYIWRHGITMRLQNHFMITGGAYVVAILIILAFDGSKSTYFTTTGGLLLVLYIAQKNLTFIRARNIVGDEGTPENVSQEIEGALLMLISALLVVSEMSRYAFMKFRVSSKTVGSGRSFGGGGTTSKW